MGNIEVVARKHSADFRVLKPQKHWTRSCDFSFNDSTHFHRFFRSSNARTSKLDSFLNVVLQSSTTFQILLLNPFKLFNKCLSLSHISWVFSSLSQIPLVNDLQQNLHFHPNLFQLGRNKSFNALSIRCWAPLSQNGRSTVVASLRFPWRNKY
jgi:hypothetical protein